MKRSYKRLYIFELLTFFILFFNSFFHTFLTGYGMMIFLVILIIIFKLIFGLEKSRHGNRKEVITEILIFLLIFFTLYYLAGLLIGFAKTTNYLNVTGITKVLLPLSLTICLEEYLRFEILTKSEGEKILTITTCLLFIFFHISNMLNYNTFDNSTNFFIFWAILLLPSISNNILCTYLSIKTGYKTCIIYMLVFTLYEYILPIIPNPNEYLKALIDFLVPILLMLKMYHYFKIEEDELITREYSKQHNLSLLFPTLIVIILVYFVSGYFKFYAVTIASGSMRPYINIGDVVIINQKQEKNKLTKGDIIAFKYNGVIIVHRIHNIMHTNGKKYYYTKGDANKDADTWVLKEKDIIGQVKGRIRWIGLPTTWVNNVLER